MNPHLIEMKARRLGQILHEAAADAGLSGKETAEKLGHTNTWWSKLIRAHNRLPEGEVVEVLRLVGANKSTRDEVLELIRELGADDDRIHVARPGSRRWMIAMDRAMTAPALCEVQSRHVPELLRTDGYHLGTLEQASPRDRELCLELLHHRQDQLRKPGRAAHFLIYEHVLTRRVGSRTIMREQIDKLIRFEQRIRNVDLGLIPSSAVLPTHHPASVKIVHGQREFVVVDVPVVGAIIRDDPSDFTRHNQDFVALNEIAVTGDSLIEHLESVRPS